MKQISIVGFGRFGQTLYRLLKDDFAITLFNRSPIDTSHEFTPHTTIATSIKQIYDSKVIFYAVPIAAFEDVIKTHRPYIKPHHILIDVLSVKLHPAKIFAKYLKNTQALLTHPMFGPDSSQDGFAGLPIIINQFTAQSSTYNFWKEYFSGKQLRVIDMSPDQHDQLAAASQGLTHFIGRLLQKVKFTPTAIDSPGTKKLHEVVGQTCHDTWQLFTGLQHFNPYTKPMRINLGQAYDQLYNQLLPKQVHPGLITFGLQGGQGSFNEEAILYYVKRAGIKAYQLEYLYTSQKVLAALHKGDIDIAQFAIHNSVGGIVQESLEAMAKYKFTIVDQFAIKISHALMIRPDAHFTDIDTIMTHPQVLAQCHATLLEKYPHLKQTSGEKDLIDHAMVAKYLSTNKLPQNIATLGSRVLAQMYHLKVVEDNLQDSPENYTSFLQVKL